MHTATISEASGIMKAAYELTAIVIVLMLAQSVLGLAFRDQYRDAAWIALTWLGNDWVTLVVALPLLAGGLAATTRGSSRGLLLWLGALGYALYNYAYYLFGAALNAFFPLYLAAVIAAALALIVSLSTIPARSIARRFPSHAPVRLIGGYFLFVSLSLSVVWIGMWFAHVFAGMPTPIEPEAFKVVAALDITLMVPALALGGGLLWKHRPWGYVVAAIAGVQASLYLLVLSINSINFVVRGLANPPGEIPLWGSLAAVTFAATLLLFAHVGPRVEV